MVIKKALVLGTVALPLLGCAETPGRPNVDGYTLQGMVSESDSGAPMSTVDVLVGLEPDPEFHHYVFTDSSGAFLFQPSPATAPNNEIFRFEKAGYVSVQVPARTARRVGEHRYRLEVHIQRESGR
jgi:hypothetical protein